MTLIGGGIELITLGSFPTHFNKYLQHFTLLHLDLKEWGQDAEYLEGEVILWVETGDMSCFMI